MSEENFETEKEEHSPLCRVMRNLYPERWEKQEKEKRTEK